MPSEISRVVDLDLLLGEPINVKLGGEVYKLAPFRAHLSRASSFRRDHYDRRWVWFERLDEKIGRHVGGDRERGAQERYKDLPPRRQNAARRFCFRAPITN